MRDELKTVFYTASPHTSYDQYNAREVDGYGDITEYSGLCVETEEREVMDGFGYRPNYSLHIILTDEAALNCTAAVHDGLWTTRPTKQGFYYLDPPYTIEAIRHFQNRVMIDARKSL